MRRPLLSRDGLFTNSNIYQHVCMYSMFMMSGTVDFLGHLTAPVPEGSEKVCCDATNRLTQQN